MGRGERTADGGAPALPDPAPLLAAYDLALPVEVFALPASGNSNRTVGLRTGAGELVWKTYANYGDPARILYEHRLLAWLAGAGLSFAVPAPIPARDGATLRRAPEGWQSLAPRLPGARLDPRARDQVGAFGAALGELHAALQCYPPAPQPDVPPQGELHRIHPRLPEPFTLTPRHLRLPDAPPQDRRLGWWREELAGIRAFVAGPYRTLPWQVSHNDFIPNNTLFGGDRLTAVLDFEFAALDARALDLAMGLQATMQVWRDPEPWEMVGAFCRGYAHWLRPTEGEVAHLPQLLRLRNAWSALWWLGRALVRGDAQPELLRIVRMQEFVRWLARQEHRLVAVVGRTVHRA